MEFSLERYLEIKRHVMAFSPQQVQMVGVFLSWLFDCGFSAEEISMFTHTAPSLTQLDTLKYFHKNNSPEVSRQIREFERSLPKDVRKTLRKARLEDERFGVWKG